jgi:hypothetical protein
MINPDDTIKVVYDNKSILGEPKTTIKWGVKEEENNEYMCKFYIELICTDPVFRSLSPQNYDLSNWQGNLEWPIEDPTYPDGYFEIKSDNTGESTKYPVGTEFEVGSPNVVRQVTVNGDIACPLIMQFNIKGEVVNPYFINVITQEKIGFNTTFENGDVVIIDTYFKSNPLTLIREGVTSSIFGLRDKTSKLDLSLNPGVNYILYNATAGGDFLSAVLEFYDMYLGVQWVC